MNEERLGSPSEFAAQLASHLARFRDPTLPIPAPGQLAVLVDAMFFASLHEEEARRVDFSVAWQPDGHDCAAVVALATPVLVTPKNLAKLAPATSGEATSIAVHRVGDEILAWAILERSTAMHQPLTIRALDAGVLRVDYAGIPRALYARGEILLSHFRVPGFPQNRAIFPQSPLTVAREKRWRVQHLGSAIRARTKPRKSRSGFA